MKEKFSKKTTDYIGKVPDENQFPVASERCLYGTPTLSGFEGMNGTKRRYRMMGMCRAYAEMVRQDCKRNLE